MHTEMEYMLLVCVLCAFIGKGACELCYTGIWSTTYCSYGCCGSYYSQYCCQYNLGLYIGVGVTCSIIFIVAVIVFIVYMCKKSTQPGRVVNIAPAPNVATVTHFSSNDGRYQTHTAMYPQQPTPMYPPPPGPGYSGPTTSFHPPPFHPPPPVAQPPGYTPVDSKPHPTHKTETHRRNCLSSCTVNA